MVLGTFTNFPKETVTGTMNAAILNNFRKISALIACHWQPLSRRVLYFQHLQNLRITFHIQGSVHREIYASNCPTKCSYSQFIYICELLYMFRVVFPPIIMSSCQCIHRISCCERDWRELQFPSVTFTTGCNHGFTNARCCGYSDMNFWWWVEIPTETCSAVYRYK